jgi:hypothetical protein
VQSRRRDARPALGVVTMTSLSPRAQAGAARKIAEMVEAAA